MTTNAGNSGVSGHSEIPCYPGKTGHSKKSEVPRSPGITCPKKWTFEEFGDAQKFGKMMISKKKSDEFGGTQESWKKKDRRKNDKKNRAFEKFGGARKL